MNKNRLFGIDFDSVTMSEAISEISNWVRTKPRPTQYVVTPNVDHVVMYQKRADLRDAYSTAGLITADGKPVVMASKLVGRGLPECVAGSDLVPKLFDSTQNWSESLRVFMLGAGRGVAERAAQNVHAKWSKVQVVGTYSPPIGFEKNPEENERILRMISDAKPDLLVVGLGAPKQELWVHKNREQIEASATLCVGATIDFLAGEKKRAPVWLRKLSLEWLHRMLSEPKRLGPRYLKDAIHFPQIVFSQWRRGGAV